MTTPLQLTAINGVLQNQGLAANTAMTGNITLYESFANGVIQSIRIGSGNGNASNAVISDTTIGRLQTIGTGVCVALADGVPAGLGLTASNTSPGLTGLIKLGYQTVLPADLSKFCQAFSAAVGFRQETNQTISASLNSQTFLGPTFTNMDDLTTGSLSGISTDLAAFGQDAQRLGTVVALQALPDLGSPAALLSQVLAAGGLTPGLISQLETRGVLDQAQSLAGSDSVDDTVQQKFYQAMQAVRGEDLNLVLVLLDCTTEGLTSMADLLDPFRLFPTSRLSLISPLTSGTVNVYQNTSGSVSNNVLPGLPEDLISSTSSGMPYERLRAIIPADQALANKALQLSLQQVKGIQDLTMPALGRTAAAIQVSDDLPLISALTEAVPAAVANSVLSQVATGTGANGRITMGDILGTASGYNITAPLANVLTIIAEIPTTYLALTYSVMANLIAGDYGNVQANITIPTGLPGDGTYSDGDDAYANLCNIANTTISSLNTSYADKISQINQDWAIIANTVVNQNNNLVAASIDYANTVASTTAVFSFGTGLAQYGQDTAPGGAADYLVSVANVSDLAGQAIVAALREGRNSQALSDSGILPDSEIPL